MIRMMKNHQILNINLKIESPNNLKNIYVYEKWANLNLIDTNYYALKDLQKFSFWLYY